MVIKVFFSCAIEVLRPTTSLVEWRFGNQDLRSTRKPKHVSLDADVSSRFRYPAWMACTGARDFLHVQDGALFTFHDPAWMALVLPLKSCSHVLFPHSWTSWHYNRETTGLVGTARGAFMNAETDQNLGIKSIPSQGCNCCLMTGRVPRNK